MAGRRGSSSSGRRTRAPDTTYRRLIENLGGKYFFYRHGIDGVFTYVSPSVKEILGYSPEEFKIHYGALLTDNPINGEARQRTELSISGIRQPVYPVEVRHKDGSIRNCEVLEMPVSDRAGRVKAVEGIAHDVTDRLLEAERRAHLLAELEALNHELAEISREKTELVALVAHELRSPLTSIRGWAEILHASMLGAALPEKAPSILARLLARTDDMAALIDRLLHVQTLENGRLTLQLQPVDVAAAVASVLEDHRARAGAKSVGLTTALPQPLPLVCADRHALQEILDNLVSNAVKYSPPGCSVRVDAALDGDAVRLSVRDEGPGITAADRPRLFQKFARIGNRPTAGESSVGLGLSIVKRLVELMRGRVVYEDGPDNGAVFVVVLPLADAEPSRPSS
jgi:PAS domain S-box-containing protein